MNTDELRRYVEFYRDLGIKDLYKREQSQQPVAAAASADAPQPVALPQPDPAPVAVAPPAPAVVLPSLAPEGDTLLKILEDIGDCRRCRLHEGRNKLVFGTGNENSLLVFVGE